MMKKDTIYWRCIQFRAFRCPARHRQNRATGLLELVHSEHNHEQIQTRHPDAKNVSFIRSKRGAMQLHVNGYFYTKDKTRNNITFWSCTQARVYCCAARASSVSTMLSGSDNLSKLTNVHHSWKPQSSDNLWLMEIRRTA
uniref:FLYWCH-type domain-containing protein n=1 Tax=Anopheles merus TaxID=30066 RepID=A0A182UMR4_ANOME